jgi:hypothetical protein
MVAPIRLDAAPVHACFKPRGSRAGPEGVDRSPRMETTGGEGRPTGVVHPAARHGCGGRGHGDTPPARSGQDPDGMAGRFPVLAPHRQGWWWERHRAVLGACATAPVDQQAGTVKVRDLQGGAFLKAQATGVDGGETHPRAKPLEVCQHGADRCDPEDDREFLAAWGPDDGRGGPCPQHGVFRETLEAAQGHGPGTARVVLDVRERDSRPGVLPR